MLHCVALGSDGRLFPVPASSPAKVHARVRVRVRVLIELCRVGFKGGGDLLVNDVLNCGVSPR